MTFAARVLNAVATLTARCPRTACRKLHTADPSMLIRIDCSCGARLTPRREVAGISFVETPARGAA